MCRYDAPIMTPAIFRVQLVACDWPHPSQRNASLPAALGTLEEVRLNAIAVKANVDAVFGFAFQTGVRERVIWHVLRLSVSSS